MCNTTEIQKAITVSSLRVDGTQSSSRLGSKKEINVTSNEKNTYSTTYAQLSVKRTFTKVVAKKVRFEPEMTNDETFISGTSLLVKDTGGQICLPSIPAKIMDTIKPASVMTESEKRDLYWQQEDYYVFKGGAQLIAGEIRRRCTKEIGNNQNSYSNSINGIYEMSVSLADNCPAPYHNNVSLSNEIPPKFFKLLTHWTKVGHARRGLERWIVESHAKRRYAARSMTIKSVLQAQYILCEQQKISSIGTNLEEKKDDTTKRSLSEEEKVDILRKVSERCSKLVKYFC